MGHEKDGYAHVDILPSQSLTPDSSVSPSSSPPKTPVSGPERNFVDEPWRCGEPPRYAVPKNGDSWGECYKLVKKYDKDMCDAWRDEVDKLLIFAGLFSAAVTAFTIESYPWLQEGPNDQIVQYLAQISVQLSSGTNNSSSLAPPQPFTVTSSVVRINIFWFLSLTLSLSVVLLGILCMQWLREYQRESTLPYKGAIGLRQMRYEGFINWGVPQILSALPLLLQAALILFFAGVLDLLWSLNKTVAACITAAVGIVLCFLIATTVGPTLQYIITPISDLMIAQCPYKSPQSWAFHRLTLALFGLIPHHLRHVVSRTHRRLARLSASFSHSNWVDFDIHWRRTRDATVIRYGTAMETQDGYDIVQGLSWIHKSFAQSVDVVYPIYHCFRDLQVSAAVEAVSSTYPHFSDHFYNVFEKPDSNYDVQTRREILSAIVLGFYVRTHPTLEIHNLELLIRITNTAGVLWFEPSLRVLQRISDGSSAYIPNAVPPDMLYQFLNCLKTLFNHDVASIEKAVDIWEIIHHLLAGWEPDKDIRPLQWSFEMLEEYDRWLRRPAALDQSRFRVQLCVAGMVTAFRRTSPLHAVWAKLSGFQKATALVKTLDRHVYEMGGISRMRKEYGWIDLDLTFDDKEWNHLVESMLRLQPSQKPLTAEAHLLL